MQRSCCFISPPRVVSGADFFYSAWIHAIFKRMQKYYWIGYCRENRIVATEKIAAIINEYGCLITANMFSDISTSFTIEVASKKADALNKALNDYIHLADQGMVAPPNAEEITIMLNVTFTKGTGNLKIEVPAVPG